MKSKNLLLSLLLCLTGFCFFSTNVSNNKTKVQATGDITRPLAWYNFSDLSNVGKDACGHFDLTLYGNDELLVRDGNNEGIKHGSASLYAPSIREAKDFSDYFENFTLSFYFKPTAEARTSRLCGNGNYQLHSGSAIYYSNDEYGHHIIPDIGTAGNYLNGSANGHWDHWITVENLDQWHHFAASVDSINGHVTYFYDGAVTSQFDAEIDYHNIQQTFSLLGVTHTAGGGAAEFYNGFIDDFRIYDMALSANEMSKITRGTLTDLQVSGEKIASVEYDSNIQPVNSLLEGEFVYDNLPKQVTLTGTNGTIKQSDICYYNYDKVGNNGTAYGMIMDHSLKNDKGLGVVVNFEFTNDAELPLIMSPAFTDNLVLQRNGARVFGRAGNTTVTVTLDGETPVSTQCHNGEWEVTLNLEESTTPRNLTITTGHGEAKVLSNVLVGEVWYCSGQSNMDWNVYQTSGDTKTTLENANYNNIRVMKRTMNSSKSKKVEVYSDYWKAPSVYADMETMSAIATSYAINLRNDLQAKEGKIVPVGIISAAIGGSGIEQWLSQETINEVGSRIDNKSGKFDCEYYNGMSWSVRNYSIRGVVWYQGEDNVYAPAMYKEQLKGYVREMESLFNNENLTFICAQLPMYNMIEWADFRQMQWEVSQEVPELYFVTGIDLGEYNDIHPQKDKFLFASRMSGVAMKYVYGDQSASGLSPYPDKIYYENNKIRIIYGSEGRGLTPKFNSTIDGFEVLVNGNWVDVRAEILNDEIILTDFEGTPMKVRYFYLANTVEYDAAGGFNYVYNSHNLPLAPFILPLSSKMYNVSFESLHGTISVNSTIEVESGTTVNVTITPESGYEVESITQNGQEIYFSGNTFTTSMIMKDTEIIIYYKQIVAPKIFTVVAVSDTSKGSIRVSSETVTEGGLLSVVITPNDGYEIDKVTVNANIANTTDGVLVLTNIGTDIIIVVTYKSTSSSNGCGGTLIGSTLISAVSLLALALFLTKGKQNRKEIL